MVTTGRTGPVEASGAPSSTHNLMDAKREHKGKGMGLDGSDFGKVGRRPTPYQGTTDYPDGTVGNGQG